MFPLLSIIDMSDLFVGLIFTSDLIPFQGAADFLLIFYQSNSYNTEFYSPFFRC